MSNATIRRTVRYVAFVWLLLSAVSLAWHLWSDRVEALELARTEARASYEKDLLYRRWVSRHGGVYVPPSEQTPPNPHLELLPERDVITTQGRALTLVNPAYMTRQVSELAKPGTTRARITSLMPLRPGNAPDPWEREALLVLGKGAPEFSAETLIGEANFLRLMRPMVVEPDCLKCHGQQGYQVGDLRGGISVSVPLAPYFESVRKHQLTKIGLHLAIAGFGLGGLYFGQRRMQAAVRERFEAESAFRAMFALNPNPMWVIDRGSYRFLAVNDAALQLYGYSREEFLQLTTLDIRPLEERPRIVEALRRADSSLSFDGVWRHQKKGGEELLVEVSSQRVNWAGHDARSVLVINVTGRERALEQLRCSESALKASETRFRVLFDHSPMGMFEEDFSAVRAWLDALPGGGIGSVDAHLRAVPGALAPLAAQVRMLFANQRGIELLGHGEPGGPGAVPDEALRQFNATLLESFRPELPALLGGESRVRREISIQDRAGQERMFETTLEVLPGCERYWERVIVSFIDITARVRAEAERRKLARAVEQSPVTVVITDPNGCIEYANPQFTRSTGYELSEVIGRNPRVLKSGAHPPEFYREIWHTISAGREWRGELCNRRKDGTLFWEEASLSPVTDEHGRITHYLAVKEDITASRAALETIREQAALLDVTRDAIIVVDLEGVVTFWNRGAEMIYGFSVAEAVGRDLTTLVSHQPNPQAEAARQAILTRGDWVGELKHGTKSGGSVTVRARGVLMRSPVGMPRSILLTATDITEAKRLEAQLLRAQRLESIGSLASGVAHDLNNVLSPIMMAIELLRPLAASPGDRDLLTLMSESVHRGADVVRQLLLFSRGVDSPGESIDVCGIVKEVLRMVRETFPRSVAVKGESPPNLWPVFGHATQVFQVIVNLCVNARDAMPAGGQLNLVVRNRELDEEFARANLGARPGRFVEIAVIDSGSGIAPEVMERIFDPFFTTKEQGKGTGLGLPTALGIVKHHHGFMTVESQVGAGSEFRVFLPVREAGTDAPSLPRHAAELGGRGEAVLVVDDEMSIRQILKRSLEDANYRPVLASSGQEALGVLQARDPEVRAVILDMMMPGIDGVALVSALRAVAPDLPVLACSGLGHFQRELRAAGFARVGFLPKPFTVEQVLGALRPLFDPVIGSDSP